MMKWIGLGILACAFLLGGLVYQAVAGETSFNGGYGGLYTWNGGNSFSGSGFPLGVTYVPDRVVDVPQTNKNGTTIGVIQEIVSSPLFFSTTQVVRDGDPDLNFTGVGYRLYNWRTAGVEIYLEADVALKLVSADTYKVGGYGGIRVPFEVNTQKFRFQVGGGWVDDPIFVFAINFATK